MTNNKRERNEKATKLKVVAQRKGFLRLSPRFRLSLFCFFVLSLGTVALRVVHEVNAAGAYNGSYGSSAFVMLVKTDNVGSSTSTQFTIPTIGSGYNYNVDCNDDGSFDTTGATGNYTCNYGSPGTYSVVIQGTFPRIYFADTGDKLKLLEIQQWGNIHWGSMNNAFYGTANMQVTAVDSPDLSGVTTTNAMFAGASSFNADLNDWDVSNVTNMSYMFSQATAFNGNISSWDVSNVTNMQGMFLIDSAFNQPLNSWDVSSVTNMSGMFNSSAFNQPLSNWDTSSVTSTANMFWSAPFNQDISNWDTSNVTNMYRMFGLNNPFNQDISGWDVSSVTSLKEMFLGNYAFNRDISGWDVSSVTNMDGTFISAYSFNQSIGDWDMSSVVAADDMLSGSGMDGANYDATLSGWSAQTLHSGVTFGASGLHYCASTVQRQYIIDTYSWIINDNGQACMPDVETGAVSNITDSSATVELNLVDDGGSTPYQLYILYNTDGSGNGYSAQADTYDEGIQSINLTGLSCETTYYYKAYVQNGAGSDSGDFATFTTDPCPIPPEPPEPTDLKLDITLKPPGLIQGQDTSYMFTVSNIGSTSFENGSAMLYFVVPDGITMSGPSYQVEEDNEPITVYTDETSYFCYDYTSFFSSVPSFTYHLGKGYACETAIEALGPNSSQDITLPFTVTGPVDNTTVMRALIFGYPELDADTLESQLTGSPDDIFTFPSNNIATYTGTSPGSTMDSGEGNNEEDNSSLDLNNDGTPDSEQAFVHDLTSSNGKPLALEVSNDCSLSASNVNTETNNNTQDPAYDYPEGLVAFSADCLTPGYTATVKLYYYDTDKDNLILRKYNPNTNAYFNLTGQYGATFEQTTINNRTVTIATYRITDGQELDIDNQTNGSIQDPVGIATLSTGSANTGIERHWITQLR